MKATEFYVPLAYDRGNSGEICGKGTAARCDVCLQTHNRRSYWRSVDRSETLIAIYVLIAGYTKRSPTQPDGTIKVALSEQMGDYVHASKKLPTITIDGAKTWGTEGEIRESFGIIEAVCEKWKIARPTIFVATNLAHSPRVFLWAQRYRRRGWSVRFIRAQHGFGSLKERIGEAAKFFATLGIIARNAVARAL